MTVAAPRPAGAATAVRNARSSPVPVSRASPQMSEGPLTR